MRRLLVRGFTLIELLVALSIFAILSLMSYRALDSVFRTREHLKDETAKIRDVALLFARLDDDFANLLERRAHTADGLMDDVIRLTAVRPTDDDATLVFSRSGFAGGLGALSAPQRVGYRHRDEKLELLIWPAIDNAPRSRAQSFVALAGVRTLQWRAMDTVGNWTDVWRSTNVADPNRPAAIPRALELRLTLNSGEEISRIFALGGYSRG